MHERPVWAEIDRKALAHNIKEIRRVTKPAAKIMAVVKANAYGHGAVEASKVFLANGADYLGVAFLGEAMELRKAGIVAPILVLGYTPPEQVALAIAKDILLAVFDIEQAENISAAAIKLGKKARVHIKIDTGMGRIGFLAAQEETLGQVKRICGLPYIEAEGIFSHLASADESDKSFAKAQIAAFREIVEKLAQEGISFIMRHIANSAAIIELPESHLDLVRPGISLYGLYPSDEVDKSVIQLRPAMAWKAKIISLKEVPKGFTVSYGCTYKTDKKTIIGTLPLGYADGYSRLLSSKGEVLVKGQRAPIVGRVCMDQCMIDVGQVPGAKTGDEVVLIGHQDSEEIPVEEMAVKIGTINYEIICDVSYRVPREYIE